MIMVGKRSNKVGRYLLVNGGLFFYRYFLILNEDII